VNLTEISSLKNTSLTKYFAQYLFEHYNKQVPDRTSRFAHSFVGIESCK